MNDSKIIVALDFAEKKQAEQFVDQVDPSLCKLKVGKGMFTRLGPDFVRELINKGFDIFLDLKFHDIPNTVSDACKAAADMGVWMLNVHALGGRRMMQAAVEALSSYGEQRPLLIAVTILTSLEGDELGEIGLPASTDDMVRRLALLSQDCGVDGIVCSARDIAGIKSELADEFLYVTPGIRLHDDCSDDQKRVLTPQAALAQGASYLVIGRSVTRGGDVVGWLREQGPTHEK